MANFPHTSADLAAIEAMRGGRRGKTWLAWSGVLLVVGGSGAFIGLAHLPLSRELEASKEQAAKTQKELETLQKERGAREERLTALTGERDELKAQLARETAEKEAALEALAETQSQLTTSLVHEIETGDVMVVERGGQLVVDVADKVLFPVGQAEITERGQKVLQQVSETLKGLQDFHFQVSGHTDSARVKTKTLAEKYPTNWELSAARATNVVRFLIETGQVPAPKLFASGYAEHQPVASNATKYGMQRNRRIEIALVPDKKK